MVHPAAEVHRALEVPAGDRAGGLDAALEDPAGRLVDLLEARDVLGADAVLRRSRLVDGGGLLGGLDGVDELLGVEPEEVLLVDVRDPGDVDAGIVEQPEVGGELGGEVETCLLYTSPSPRDRG